MMRDELLRRIGALPVEADVGIQIGDDHLDIVDVIGWGDGEFGAIRCDQNDFRDFLAACEFRQVRDAAPASRGI